MLTLRLAPAAALVLSLTCITGCPSDDGSASTGTSETSGDPSTSETGTSTTNDTDDPGESNLIEIPGGSFAMGCGANDSECDPDNPEHQVTISAFYIEHTEVSVADYRACVDAGSCTAPLMDVDCNYGVAGRDNHPVNCVTWQQAVDYCGSLGRRLPSEAEWEFAAAGADSRTYPWGDEEATCGLAHMSQMSGDMGGYGCLTNVTSVVNNYSFGATPESVLQMAGNVDEWVNDWYADDYYTTGGTTDPQGPADGTQKVNRGGDMYDASPLNLRVFERRKANADAAVPERGFRCASDMP